jgi:hypothetical protein
MGRISTTTLIVAGVLLAMGSQVRATVIGNGSAILAPGTAGPSGGTIIYNSGPLPITAATFTGTLTSTVIQGDTTNPGGLTFTYLLTNDSTSIHQMGRLTINDFTGFLTDVSYAIPSAGVNPYSIDKDSFGDVVGFSFSALGAGQIPAGGSSALLVIRTDAQQAALTEASVINGSVAMVSAYAPAVGGNVPEPGTLAVAGLGGLGLLLRRRRSAKA